MTESRPPPHSPEAERALLGALLLDRDAIIRVAPAIGDDDFFLPPHVATYRAIRALYDRREPADLATVAAELARTGDLDLAGGLPALLDLIAATPTAVHAESYARAVARLATHRRAIMAGTRIVNLGYDERLDPADLANQIRAAVDAIDRGGGEADFVMLPAALEAYFERLDLLSRDPSLARGVPTGYLDLDHLTGGFQKGNLVILAARTGVGKTSLALGLARNAATRGHAVALFSLEMATAEIVARLLATQTGIDTQRLHLGRLRDDEWEQISAAFGRLSEGSIAIDDTAAIALADLRAKVARLQAGHGVDLVIVDYLQLVRGGNPREGRQQQVADISRGLKALARDLGIPVLALAQLSRQVERRESHIPLLSDLRESGSIEQDADVVIFIHREELYDRDTEKRGIAELHVAKHRNGPVGVINLRFFEQTTRFADLELYHDE